MKKYPDWYRQVTPQIAQKWLEHNPNNRPVNKDTVQYFAQKMQSGTWKERGGIPLIVTPSGELINGQHRLMAIVQSGVTVRLPVHIKEK